MGLMNAFVKWSLEFEMIFHAWKYRQLVKRNVGKNIHGKRMERNRKTKKNSRHKEHRRCKVANNTTDCEKVSKTQCRNFNLVVGIINWKIIIKVWTSFELLTSILKRFLFKVSSSLPPLEHHNGNEIVKFFTKNVHFIT